MKWCLADGMLPVPVPPELPKGTRTRHAIIAVAVEVTAQQQRGVLLPPSSLGFGLQCRARSMIKAQCTTSVHAPKIRSQVALVLRQPCSQAARMLVSWGGLLCAGYQQAFCRLGMFSLSKPCMADMLLQVVSGARNSAAQEAQAGNTCSPDIGLHADVPSSRHMHSALHSHTRVIAAPAHSCCVAPQLQAGAGAAHLHEGQGLLHNGSRAHGPDVGSPGVEEQVGVGHAHRHVTIPHRLQQKQLGHRGHLQHMQRLRSDPCSMCAAATEGGKGSRAPARSWLLLTDGPG